MPPTTMPAAARCPVCGAAVGVAPWRCANCETPHHGDCAQYFGGCAIYGCRDGNRPQPVERASWPAALHALRRVTIARHIQTAALLSCIGGLAGLVLVALMNFWPHQLIAVFGIPCVVGGITYFLMDATVLEFLRWRLRRELGPGRSSAIEVSRNRLVHAVPGARNASQRFKWLDRAGQITMICGVVGVLLGRGSLGMLVMVGAMMIAAADQLREHLREIELSLNRFEATYAPPALIKETIAFEDPPKA